MGRKRLVSAIAGIAVAAALLGSSAPAGVAQDSGLCSVDPTYCPIEPSTTQLRAQCIKKAKKKFRSNPAKKKAAIKKCKKKYPLSG